MIYTINVINKNDIVFNLFVNSFKSNIHDNYYFIQNTHKIFINENNGIFDYTLIMNDKNITIIKKNNTSLYEFNIFLSMDMFLQILKEINIDLEKYWSFKTVNNCYIYNYNKRPYLVNEDKTINKEINFFVMDNLPEINTENYSETNIERYDEVFSSLFFGSFSYHFAMMSVFPIFIYLKNLPTKNTKILLVDKNWKDCIDELKIILNINDDLINVIYVNNHILDISPEYNPIFYFNKLHNNLIRNVEINFIAKIMFEYMKYYFYIKYQNENIIKNYNTVYLSRKKLWFAATGSQRYIINKDEIIDYLKTKNFNVFECENMNFYEKYKELSFNKIIIIEAGATLVNLYFSSHLEDTTVIIFNNYLHYNNHSHTSVKQPYNNLKKVIQLIGYTESDINQPFSISLEELKQYIEKLEI